MCFIACLICMIFAYCANASTSGAFDLNRRVDLVGRSRSVDKGTIPVRMKTRLGEIDGFTVDVYDKPDYAPQLVRDPTDKPLYTATVFLGIPYARAPTKQNRFRPPRAHPGWLNLLATDYGPACPQHSSESYNRYPRIDEDCLYLNIFKPKDFQNERLPVLFYIHGGDLSSGSGQDFPGHVLATWARVIVVTFNYRLGVLGFLSTGDKYMPGNYGLLDQAAALTWVARNIDTFNGNPRQITVLGVGSGAMCATLLSVSPQTSHFVNALILQSGTALSPFAVTSDLQHVRDVAHNVSSLLGCSSRAGFQLLNCLRSRTFNEISRLSDYFDVFWQPVIQTNLSFGDDVFYRPWSRNDWFILDDHPRVLFELKKFNPSLSVLIGSIQNEASSIVADIKRVTGEEGLLDGVVDHLVSHYSLPEPGRLVARQAVRWMCTAWSSRNNTQLIEETLASCVTDMLYVSGITETVELFASLNIPVYQYVLNVSHDVHGGIYRHPLSLSDMYIILSSGAPFLDPELVTFGLLNSSQSLRNCSMSTVSMVASFAKFRRPKIQFPDKHMQLDSITLQKRSYLRINGTMFSTIVPAGYHVLRSKFWTQFLPGLRNESRVVPNLKWWTRIESNVLLIWILLFICCLLAAISLLCCVALIRSKRRKPEIDHPLMSGADSLYGSLRFGDTTNLRSVAAGFNSLSRAANGAPYVRGDSRSLARHFHTLQSEKPTRLNNYGGWSCTLDTTGRQQQPLISPLTSHAGTLDSAVLPRLAPSDDSCAYQPTSQRQLDDTARSNGAFVSSRRPSLLDTLRGDKGERGDQTPLRDTTLTSSLLECEERPATAGETQREPARTIAAAQSHTRHLPPPETAL